MECVICFDVLEDLCDNHTWLCGSCNCETHRKCIEIWAKRSDSGEWCCPQCSKQYSYEPQACNCPTKQENHQIPNCNNTLKCGHSCSFPQHNGKCPPCTIVSSKIYCRCKKTFSYPPNPCGNIEINCPYPCTLEKECNHLSLHSCHLDGSCPPCTVIVKKICIGGHKKITVPCFRKNIYCGELCKNKLSCGVHLCSKSCHEGPCEDENSVECKEICNRILPCSHNCLLSCHQPYDCSSMSFECSEKLKITCRCSSNYKIISCSERQNNMDYILPCNPIICKSHSYNGALIAFAKLRLDIIDEIESIFKNLINKGNGFYEYRNSSIIAQMAYIVSKYYNIECELNGDPEIGMMKIRFKIDPYSYIPNVLLSEVIQHSKIPFVDVLQVCVKTEFDNFQKVFYSFSDRIGIAVDHTKFWKLSTGTNDFILFFENKELCNRFKFSNDFYRLCTFYEIQHSHFTIAKKKKKTKKNTFANKSADSLNNSVELTNSFLALQCD